MPKPYSDDLRERVIEAVVAGASRREVAESFSLSASSAVRWLQRWGDTGSARAKLSGGSTSPLGEHVEWLFALVAEQPDLTLDEIVAAMRKQRIPGSRTAVWRFFERATEQERADVARARRRWIREQGLLEPARLVFIDETAATTTTSLVRLRGRCRWGERLVGSVPHGHWKTITLVVGLRHDGMVAPFVIDGPMNGTIFLAYVEDVWLRRRRDVVIMDNLPAHKVAGVTDAMEAVGATAFYLPPYSPDLNPIEDRSD